jgi:hypothetical protein
LLKTDIYIGTTKFSNDGFDKAFGLVHKIKYIILFANSKLTYSEINTDTNIDSDTDSIQIQI